MNQKTNKCLGLKLKGGLCMCKRKRDGLTRKQRKILKNNPGLRIATEAAANKGVPRNVIIAGINRYSYSGELPTWIKAAKN